MPTINYNYLIEESLNEVYVFDAETLKFYNVNRRGREQLGYSLEELQQMTPLDIKPEFTSLSFAKLIEPLQTGQTRKIRFETVHRRKNGTTYPVEVHLQLEKFSDEALFVALILDITERRRIESYNLGLNRIFNDSLNEIYIFDAVTLKFVEVNQGACENIGYTLDEMRHLTPLDIKPEMTPESFSSLIMPLRLGHEKKIEFTTVHLRKDGTVYPVEVHLQLSDLDEKPVFVAIILDITERRVKQAAEVQLAMKSERMRILKDFIDDTSHEFRTPMSILNTKIYLLQKQLQNEQQKQHLTVMQDQILRLKHLIDGLHELTRLDATDTIETLPTDMPKLVEEVRETLQEKYGEKRFKVDVRQPLLHLKVNPPKAKLALHHIIKNACQYSDAESEVLITLDILDNQFRIQVHDDGIGIAEREHERVFERLYRVDSSRNMDTGGAGLGLAIVQRIIELHNGAISVQSELGVGTCFCLSFPLESDQATNNVFAVVPQ